MQKKQHPAQRRGTPERIRLISEVELPDFPFRLDHRSSLLMLGSCFTEEVGRMLKRYLFPVCINPFGVTYNPLSVLGGLKALMEKEAYSEDDLESRDGLWFSFDHYTRFSHPDRGEALQAINASFLSAKQTLENASTLILTWGTAWVYRHRNKDRVVNNCHKIPSREFTRGRLTPRQVIGPCEEEFRRLFDRCSGLKIVLTVSPVRHLKDTAHGNQLSKASLLLAAEALTRSFPEQCFYFPSYEIMMDELRDYRFYGSDLVHPSETATRYIWEKFASVLISEDSLELIRELDALYRLKEHRPIHPWGTAHQRTLEHLEQKISELRNKHPDLAWSNWE